MLDHAPRAATLSPETRALLEARVASGRHGDADAVVRAALAALDREEEARRDPLDAGLLTGLFQSRVMGFSIFDLETGRTVAINDYALELAGVSRDDFESGRWDWRQATLPEHLERDLAAVAQIRAQGWCEPFEKEWIAPGGERVPLRIAGARIPGEPPRAVAYLQDLRGQRAAEEALRRSEERLELAVEAHRIGIFDWDIPGGTIVWSDEEKRIFGVGAGAFGGTIADWGDRVLPEDRVRMERDMASAMARRDTQMNFAFRIRRPDGAVRHLEGSGRFLYAVDGEPLRMVGVNIDVTERVEAEEALRESRSLLQTLFEAAPLHTGVVADRGDDLVYLLTNRATDIVLGAAEGGLAGRSLADIGMTPDEVAGWLATVRRCHEGSGPLTLEFELKQGGVTVSWFIGTFAPLPPGPDGRQRTSFVAIDIGDQKRVTEALRESEARLRSVADNLPNGLIYQAERDPDGTLRFTYLSGSVERLHGVTAEAATADFRALDDQVLPEFRPLLDAVRSHVAENGLTMDVEIPMRLPSGEVRWFRRTSAPRTLPTGGQVWDGVEIDVTERRLATEAARARTAELETVLATVPAAVWFTYDPAVRHVVRNRYATRLMGMDPDSQASFGSAGIPHIRLRRAGVDVPPGEMPLQRAMRGESIVEEEYDFVFSDGRVNTLLSSAAPIRDGEGRVIGAVSVGLDISERKRSEEQRTLLIHELNHRVKNTLATVQAIAGQSLRAAASPEAARETFTARLVALAAAHDVLTRESWEGADLLDVVTAALEPHRAEGQGRFDLSGPPVRLTPAMALSIAMALHELATNAAKYGALSGEAGRVAVAWQVEDDVLTLAWRESGGPLVERPSRRGFGTRLIERGLASELKGEVQLRYEPTGVVCLMTAPLTAAQAG
ncbi:MAG TPA: PAS domain S-box protein [Salinarimonas sp.]|nr:PAS domain S-box protein [Salinarimonas sp.]